MTDYHEYIVYIPLGGRDKTDTQIGGPVNMWTGTVVRQVAASSGEEAFENVRRRCLTMEQAEASPRGRVIKLEDMPRVGKAEDRWVAVPGTNIIKNEAHNLYDLPLD